MDRRDSVFLSRSKSREIQGYKDRDTQYPYSERLALENKTHNNFEQPLMTLTLILSTSENIHMII